MSELEGLFEFELPDGAKVEMSIHRARSLGCKNITKRCDEIVEYYKSKAKKKTQERWFHSWLARKYSYVYFMSVPVPEGAEGIRTSRDRKRFHASRLHEDIEPL